MNSCPLRNVCKCIDSVVLLCLLTHLTLGRHIFSVTSFLSKPWLWLAEEHLLHSELECQPLKDTGTSITRGNGNKIVRCHSFASASPQGHIIAFNKALRRNIAHNVLGCKVLWCRAAEQEQPWPQETLGYDQLCCWENLRFVAAAQTFWRTAEPLRHQRFGSSNRHGDRVLQSADLLSYLRPNTPV